MKVSLSSLLTFFALISSTSAWTLKDIKKVASIASVSAALSTAPMIANAVDFSGSYSDPNHVNCLRVISQTSGSATIKGTDGNPGCPADGSGKEWSLIGKVDGSNILIDFTPKGGPKDLKGEWVGDGIKFPDGNKWSLKK